MKHLSAFLDNKEKKKHKNGEDCTVLFTFLCILREWRGLYCFVYILKSTDTTSIAISGREWKGLYCLVYI